MNWQSKTAENVRVSQDANYSTKLSQLIIRWCMEKTTLDRAKIGSIIAKDVYAIDGKLLVKKGSTYREPLYDRFREYGVQEIFLTKNGELTPSTVTAIQSSLNIRDVIHDKTRIHANLQMKKTISRLKAVSNKNIHRISQLVEDMISELFEKKDFVLALSQMRSIDDYTYQHSVNVGVLSLMIGIDMNLDSHSLKQLGVGAMLHDIGKTMVPEDIIKKPSELTRDEYAEVKKHTYYGYEMLRQTDISEEAAQIALYHHEKFDGSGYGKGLKSSKIPLFSRIVAVADVYDAMSNDRIYQRKTAHDKVYREITHLGDIHFDTEIMVIFARHLNIYPTGTGVILNSGQRGIVLEQNRLYPESPFIRIFTPENRDLKKLYYDLDLSLERGCFIMDTF